MSYGLLYTIPFSSSKGKEYRVEIEKENYSGKSVELVADESPFVVNCEGDDFIYTPLRTSTASLNVFGSNYLQDLYSTEYRQYRVVLKEILKDSNKILWSGFVKPEVYTQEYGDEDFTLSIECVSAIEVLDKIGYGGDNTDFVSLWDLVKYCILESRGIYEYIYIPFVYFRNASESSVIANVLSYLKVSAQNFFDEDDAPMTCKEILEEICKVMNWTLADFGGSLYFIDADNADGKYLKSADGENWEFVSFDTDTIQNIGYDGDNHTLDILGGYNKVTIKCSNYSVEDDIPTIDFEKMVFDSEQIIGSISSGKRKFIRLYSTILDSSVYTQWYVLDKSDGTLITTTESAVGAGELLCGALAQKEEDVEYVDGKPTNIEHNYTEQIYIPLGWQTDFSVDSPKASPIYTVDKPIMIMKGGYSAYQGGGFGINFNVQVNIFKNQVGGEALDSYDFHFSLRIGEYYYHGKSDGTFIWDKNSAYNPNYPNNLEVDWQDEAIGGSGDTSLFNKTYSLKTSRMLDDGYDGLNGFIIKFPKDKLIAGDLEIIFYGPKIEGVQFDSFESMTIRNFEIGYKAEGEEKEDSDRIYENVINESYINPLDEIELKISTYNDDGACYSKLIMGEDYLKDNLYCLLVNKNIRLEDLLIQRIVSRYKQPHIKLTQQLCYKEICPACKLTDASQPEAYFNYVGGEIDYQQDTMSVVMIGEK